MAFRALKALVLVLAVTLLAGGCSGGDAEVSPEDREQIRTLLEEYLPLMGDAYESGRFEALEGYAVEKEISSLRKRISDLALGGRDLRPELLSVEVEDITIWNYSNAFVTTLEVWNIKILATGSNQILSQDSAQRSRVKYQIKRREGGWQVLYRTLDATFEG